MKKRIFSAIFIISLTIIFLINGIVTYSFDNYYKDNTFVQLRNEAKLVIRGVENEGVSYLDKLTFENYRITWVDKNGNIVYDASFSSSQLENHLDRDEIKDAFSYGEGESLRYSSSMMEQSFNVAYKIKDETVIRLQTNRRSLLNLILTIIYPVYIVAIALIPVSMILSYLISSMILKPLKNIDLDDPLKDNKYKELQPILKRIDEQQKVQKEDKEKIILAYKQRQDFTNNVSHELKTPLHIISGYSELIKEGIAKKDDIQLFASKISSEANRMIKLVNDIMSLAKLDTGYVDYVKEEIEADKMIASIISSLSYEFSLKNITVESSLDKVKLLAYREPFHSLFFNLIDNAIKYNVENGKVFIFLKSSEEITFTVKDTGIGMKKEELDRIFERFYRVDKSHSKEVGGTGLGLSIVKHSCMLLNYKIDVSSKEGEGTVFTVLMR